MVIGSSDGGTRMVSEKGTRKTLIPIPDKPEAGKEVKPVIHASHGDRDSG